MLRLTIHFFKKQPIKAFLEQDENKRNFRFLKAKYVSNSLTLLNMFNVLAIIRMFVIFILVTKNKLLIFNVLTLNFFSYYLNFSPSSPIIISDMRTEA